MNNPCLFQESTFSLGRGRTRLRSAVMMRAQIHYLISAPSEEYTVYGKNIKVGEYAVQYSDLKQAPVRSSCRKLANLFWRSRSQFNETHFQDGKSLSYRSEVSKPFLDYGKILGGRPASLF